MQLAGRCREHDLVIAPGPRDALRLALQGKYTERNLGGDVLVRDRDLASLPKRAEEPERRGDDLVIDLRRAQLGIHRLADCDLGRDLVTREQRGGVRAPELADLHLVRLTPVVLDGGPIAFSRRPYPLQRRADVTKPGFRAGVRAGVGAKEVQPLPNGAGAELAPSDTPHGCVPPGASVEMTASSAPARRIPAST